MNDYYSILDRLIRDEVDKHQKVAIYPFGKFGLQAQDILMRRYGQNCIIIDNGLAKYNPRIIDINKFQEIDDKKVTIILCTLDITLNNKLHEDLIERKLKAEIKNILDIPIEQHDEKIEYFKHLKNLCRVKGVKKHRLIRIGGKNDGAYIMLDDFIDCNIAYSFGIGDNISWDEDMVGRGIEIYCYDHTIECIPKTNDKLHFRKIGISGKDYFNDNLLSLATILRSNCHDMKKNFVLKMDVEGAEWEFINSIDLDILSRFSQITFELHGLTDMNRSEEIINVLTKINKTHQSIWVHANNAGRVEQARNIVIPDLLEITYVLKDRYDFEDIEYSCPLDIDEPNLADRFDIRLSDWGMIKMER